MALCWLHRMSVCWINSLSPVCFPVWWHGWHSVGYIGCLYVGSEPLTCMFPCVVAWMALCWLHRMSVCWINSLSPVCFPVRWRGWHSVGYIGCLYVGSEPLTCMFPCVVAWMALCWLHRMSVCWINSLSPVCFPVRWRGWHSVGYIGCLYVGSKPLTCMFPCAVAWMALCWLHRMSVCWIIASHLYVSLCGGMDGTLLVTQDVCMLDHSLSPVCFPVRWHGWHSVGYIGCLYVGSEPLTCMFPCAVAWMALCWLHRMSVCWIIASHLYVSLCGDMVDTLLVT